MPVTRTFLLDMDGTLICKLQKDEQQQTRCYYLEYHDLPILLKYHPFLSEIQATDRIMSGSNRTDLSFDLNGIYKDSLRKTTGVSISDVLTQISNETKATIDPFLFGDIGKIKSIEGTKVILDEELPQTGSALNEMILFYQNNRKLDDLKWIDNVLHLAQKPQRAFSDQPKILAMYVWLQHIAKENIVSASNPHEVMFYEDSYMILQELIEFYGNNTDWIPEGMILKIHCYAPARVEPHYEGNSISPELRKEIKGTGKPHPNFVQTARHMSSCMIAHKDNMLVLDKMEAINLLNRIGKNDTQSCQKILVNSNNAIEATIQKVDVPETKKNKIDDDDDHSSSSNIPKKQKIN